MFKSKMRKGDLVQVISGKEKGKTGKISEIKFDKNSAYVSGVNIVKKTVKKKSQQEKGGVIEIEAPLNLSKLKIVSKGVTSRIKYVIGPDKKKIRVAKKTGEKL